ncbi:MAG: hypothetical protein K8S87_10475 [Planctomycetes bacterium]|nr:hypothetical protein [Planctomycetota bacterium]
MEIDKKSGIHPAFLKDCYLTRKKMLKLFGGAFHIYDNDGNLVMYSKQKAFKLKEDIRVYTDESMSEEILVIKTPHVIDFSAKYYVHDSSIGQDVGIIQRKGLKSIFKDEWIYFTAEEKEIGRLKEYGTALLSRMINWIPQKYQIVSLHGNEVANIKQHFNPLVLKYTMRIDQSQQDIDPRLLIATGVLLSAIEGRQRD